MKHLPPTAPLAMVNGGPDRFPGAEPPPPSGAGGLSRGRARRLADLLPRAISSLVLAGAAITGVWLGGVGFALIWFAAALAVALEWQNLIGAARPRLRLAIAGAGLAAATALAAQGRFGFAGCALLIAGVLLALAAGQGRRLWAFGGILYAGALIVSVVALDASAEFGARSIFWLCATVWGTDVFAYFGGRLIGGPKLWPRISPSKTWSGTLCGVIAGASVGAFVGVCGLDGRALPIFALGLVAALLSQAGDIFESAVKRRFNVKDSSSLIPGHGGFMDRLDGFVAAASFAALFGALRGLPTVAAGLFNWL